MRSLKGLKNKYMLILVLGISFFVLALVAPVKSFALSGSEFNNANIIDDSIFFNSGTMSASSIQTFLNGKVPTCDTNGTQPYAGTTRAAYSTSRGYPPPYTCLKDFTQTVPSIAADSFCSQGINAGTYSAAQIIYYVSRACSINPQTLMVILQKEQSLITDDWPWSNQYTKATGFGCPDSDLPSNVDANNNNCYDEYEGFFKQVYYSARQFNRYVQQPENYNYAAGRTSYVAFNPNGGCGGTNVTIQNNATAALYNYTPYQPNNAALSNLYGTGDGCSAYGNRNFWRMFTDWFGSTNGDLVRTLNNPTVYLISGSNKHPINSQNILDDYSRLGPVRYVSDSYLAAYSTSTSIKNLVQGEDSSLYLVNASIKMRLTSCSGDVVAYGYTCDPGQYISLTQAQINKLASGPTATLLLKSNASPTIYYMTNGKKRPVASWSDIERMDISTTNYNSLSNSFVSQYPTGPTAFGSGSLIKTSSSNMVYVVRDLTYLYTVLNLTYPKELGLPEAIKTVSPSDLSAYTISGSSLTNKVNCGANNYLGTLRSNYSVSGSIMTNYGYTSGQFLSGGGLCGVLNISGTSLGRYIRVGNVIYYINNSGQKQTFMSYNSYVSHQSSNGNPGYVNVSQFFANTIPNGSNL